MAKTTSTDVKLPAHSIECESQLAEIDRQIAKAKANEAAGAANLSAAVAHARDRVDAAAEVLKAQEVALLQAEMQLQELEGAIKGCDSSLASIRFDINRLETVAALSPDSAPASSELNRLVTFDRAILALRWFAKTAPQRRAAKARAVSAAERMVEEKRQTLERLREDYQRAVALKDKARAAEADIRTETRRERKKA